MAFKGFFEALRQVAAYVVIPTGQRLNDPRVHPTMHRWISLATAFYPALGRLLAPITQSEVVDVVPIVPKRASVSATAKKVVRPRPSTRTGPKLAIVPPPMEPKRKSPKAPLRSGSKSKTRVAASGKRVVGAPKGKRGQKH